MKKILFILLLTTITLQHQNAQAHVLITDDTNSIGAVLHISPDDDPVAGEPATFHLDLQNQRAEPRSIELKIRDVSGRNPGAEVDLGTSFSYRFPSQGVYELVFIATTESSSYTFTHSQLVSRGIAGGALEKPTYAWAEILLLTGGIGFILTVIIIFNRRKEIARQSTF